MTTNVFLNKKIFSNFISWFNVIWPKLNQKFKFALQRPGHDMKHGYNQCYDSVQFHLQGKTGVFGQEGVAKTTVKTQHRICG
jgi:hypothetical protein